MTRRTLDAETLLTLAEAAQEVRIAPEQAARMAELHARFNAALSGQRHRLALEAEPADFARVLHRYRDGEP